MDDFTAKYDRIKTLGEEGFGRVYLARQRSDGKVSHATGCIQVRCVFCQVLLALHYCQTPALGRGVFLHRNIKPKNGEFLAEWEYFCRDCVSTQSSP